MLGNSEFYLVNCEYIYRNSDYIYLKSVDFVCLFVLVGSELGWLQIANSLSWGEVQLLLVVLSICTTQGSARDVGSAYIQNLGFS